MIQAEKILIPILLFWIKISANSVTFDLEYATTDEQRTWGLMQRTKLKTNQGMAFIYPDTKFRTFWMFNTFLNLSIAFLDENKVICEIHELKAYPEMMDPKRPVQSLKDFKQYSKNESTIRFFINKGITSSFPTRYVIEMPEHWFSNHQIKAGDRVLFNTDDSKAYVIRSQK